MAARLPIPQVVTATADALHAHYVRRAEDWRRDHLGASAIGHECDRFLWLTFRWAAPKQLDGRTLRLLERGNREEQWILDDLRALGIKVLDMDQATGRQWTMPAEWGPHFGGSVDAIVLGLIEAPEVRHVLEVKTSNTKQFALMLEKGVERAKFEHWAQMQVYMLGLGIEWAFYISVCKDDDRIYTERVPLDKVRAQTLVDRGRRICAAAVAPPKLPDSEYPPCVLTSKDGTRWPCQFYELCHGKQMPATNCRTCIDAHPTNYGFSCRMHKIGFINADLSRTGCDKRIANPEMVNAQVIEADDADRRIVFQFADGDQRSNKP